MSGVKCLPSLALTPLAIEHVRLFFRGFLPSDNFMPHGYCFQWNPLVLWLHVISDAVIVVSYFCIPIVLIYLIVRRRDLPFNWMFGMFGLFIVGCGTTHLMEIWTIWHASYLTAGVIKAITAFASAATAILLVRLLPKAVALPSGATMKQLSLNQVIGGIVASAMDAIITIDGQQRILMFNQAAEKMFDCPASEAMGRPIEGFIPERFRGGHASHIRRFGETGVTSRSMGKMGAIWGRRADGTEFPIEASISQVEAGGQKLFTVILRDITERKQLEQSIAERTAELDESRARLAGIIGSAMDAIITVDERQSVLMFNEAAERMFGCPTSEAIGGPLERFIPERFRRGHASHIRRFGETGTTSRSMGTLGAIWGVRSNGEEFPVEASISQADAEGKKLFTVILRDVTERKRAETRMLEQTEELSRQAEELSRSRLEVVNLNAELERRVLERTAQLEAANKELEAFTYSVSHDLRAPLRHISGFTKILSEDFGSSLPPEAQQHLQRVEQGAHRMGQLVDELLNLTRVGRQTVTMQVTGLASIVKEVQTTLLPEIEGRKVEWKIGELPFVECDPMLMRLVFQNLMTNALKYSRPRSPAVIEIGQCEKNGQAAIFVRDNGVGFSMKYADKLFGVFQRLHRAEDFEGTGVGLATVYRIIQKHGGRVWAEAELDRGATFYFTLGGFGQLTAKAGGGA
jgi:PAS domain S-box-containing protein